MELDTSRARLRDARGADPVLRPDIWSGAPGFRRLVVASAAFAALSGVSYFGLPFLSPAPEIPPSVAPTTAQLQAPKPVPSTTGAAQSETSDMATCSLNVPREGDVFVGKARGLVDDAAVRKAVEVAEHAVNGKMSPEYASKRRELVAVQWGNSKGTWFAVIPDGLVVNPGDTVEIVSRRRDPRTPCSFIPWTLSRVVTTGG